MKRPLIPDGLISRAIREGIMLRRKLIDGGMSQADADQIVGQGLKAAWEQSRKMDCAEDTGYYRCPKCHDSGWLIVKPSYMEQKRIARLYGDDAKTQDYMQKCDPCAWLEHERAQRREKEGEPEGLAAAGLTKAPERRRFQR